MLLAPPDLHWADLVVLMDRYNWARLSAMGADQAKVVWLGSLAEGPVEIPDPYGMDEQRARAVLDRLALTTGVLVGYLRKS